MRKKCILVVVMAAPRSPEDEHKNRWFFTKEQLLHSPSRSDGVDPEKELAYRQQAASLIKNMGDSLKVNALCVSTAVVYMHRFFMVHSFKGFDRSTVSIAALFLAAKVEEQPRRLEVVAKVAYSFLNKGSPPLDSQSEAYTKLVDDITHNELLLLQTLGFEVAVEHPHPHVAVCTDLIKVSKDLIQTAYFLAHNSQLVTTFCLQHKPTLIAAVCIHLTCKWKGLKIPLSTDNKNWWEYVDNGVTHTQLEELAREFLTIIDKSPRHIKKRITESLKATVQQSKPHGSGGNTSSQHKDKPSSSAATVASASTGHPHPPDKHRHSKGHHHPQQPHPVKAEQHLKHSNPSHHHHLTSKPHQHVATNALTKPHKVQTSHSSTPGSSNSLLEALPSSVSSPICSVSRQPPPPPPPPSLPPPLPPPPPPPEQTDSKNHRNSQPYPPSHLHAPVPVKHKPAVPGNLSFGTGQKHSLSNPSLPPKHKRLKTEDHSQAHLSHRQSLSLEHYRQTRKQHSEQQGSEKQQHIELKIEPITPSTPLPIHANFGLKPPASHISENWSSQAKPPLPPPLPSDEAFPPPPPPPPPPPSFNT